MPTLIGLMVAVGILRASGFLDFISRIIGHFTARIGFPGELVPLSIVKMFSSSAATGLLPGHLQRFRHRFPVRTDRLHLHVLHRDHFLYHERYFMTAKVTKTRYTLPGALIATLAGLAASVFLAMQYT